MMKKAAELRIHEKDTGSSEVQIALLTDKIETLSKHIKETVTGTAQILEIFKVSGTGKVAGSKVIEGEILSGSEARLIRDGSIIYTGKISSIFREKNQAKQVSNGQECGITLKDFMDFQKNDTIEAYSSISTERAV